MFLRRRRWLITLLFSFFLTTLVINLYFAYSIIQEKNNFESDLKSKSATLQPDVEPVLTENNRIFNNKLYGKYESAGLNLTATVIASKKIKKAVLELEKEYTTPSDYHKFILHSVVEDLTRRENLSLFKLWKIAEKWVTGTQVLPEKAPLLGSVLNLLCSSKIIKAETSKKGTQLKLMLTLEGRQKALFKPQWYTREEIINGIVYAGKDRHNAEVAAFHLSLLLNLRRVPLTVGRKVNLRREIMPVGSKKLLDTFYQEGNRTCFYGSCLYCEPKSPVCDNGEVMEGALIMWLPSHIRFENHPNPWQRSYKRNLTARWEVELDYCETVRDSNKNNKMLKTRLLDLVDSVVFDFLLDNGDRHHYEIPSGFNHSSTFLFDNGKSFGNPQLDHLDILAPLYQCCILRRRTWERLKIFSGGSLGYSLQETLKYSHIAPVLTKAHFDALDRRLLYIFATVEICIKEYGFSHVFF